MSIIRSFAGAVMAAAVLAIVSPAQAEPVTLLMASAINAENPTSRAMEIFKAEVVRRSHNALDVKLNTGLQSGAPLEIVQKVRAGSVFATWVPATYISRIVPEIDVLNLPFVFNRNDDVLRILNGPVGKLIEAKLDTKGFTILAWMDFGARSVVNAKRALKTVEDFKDLRLRLAPLELLHATFRALGTTAVMVDSKDLYMALQQGDVDGFESPYSISNSFGFSDNQKYISDTNHLLDPVGLVANKNAFIRLTPEQQKAVRDAAKVAEAQERKMVHDEEAAALAALQAKGLQFDSVPPETRMAIRKVAAGVINGVKGQIGAELVDRVMAEAGRRQQAAK
jgi:tripartite ATP-independent transporter DctP family solute receptor